MSTPRIRSLFTALSIFASLFFARSLAFASPDPSTYTRPLLFAPEDNNIFLTSPQLKWDLEKDQLSFGGISFDGSVIHFRSSAKDGRFGIGLGWPTNLGSDGVLQIRIDGKIVWKKNVDSSDLKSWQGKLKTDGSLKGLLGTTFGETRLKSSDLPGLKENPVAQACFTRKKNETEWLEVCSAPMRAVDLGDGAVKLEATEPSYKPTVKIFDEDLGARGLANFTGAKPIQVRAIFSNGGSIAFALIVPKLTMLDVVWKAEQKSGKEFIIFTGQGAKPIGEVKILQVPANHFWSETGLGEEVIWQTTIPKDSPLLRVIAPFNIPFTYIVQFTDLPDEGDRIYISTRTGAGTYSSTPRIYGAIPSQAKIGSHEKSVRKTNSNEFQWTFSAPQKGDRNKARISLFKKEDGKEKEWVGNYQLYRGYPLQAALRLTGLTTDAGKLAVVGEASLTYFPDTIFLDSYLLDYHRWGFSTRYLNALTPIKVKNTVEDDTTGVKTETIEELNPFRTFNFDARYNLVPGLWNRDQLYGPLVSFSSIALSDNKASFLGAGAFWARSMPLFIDKIFNIIPLLRYPKYVDVEFIYYGYSLKSDVEAGKTMFLNFQGRVFWTKRFFGEGGFGLKRFNFKMQDHEAATEFYVGYGTAGLGLTF